MKHHIFCGIIEPDEEPPWGAHLLIDLPGGSPTDPMRLDDWLDENGAALVQLFDSGVPNLSSTWEHLPEEKRWRSCHLLIDLEPEG